MRLGLILLSIALIGLNQSIAQDDIDGTWDHWLVMGNKLNFSNGGQWRHSHEIQWRANDNWNELERIFYEGMVSYTPNSKWEIVPDLRISKLGNERSVEVRPGIGIIRKFYTKPLGKNQMPGQWVHQIKWQADIKEEFRQGLRYVITYSRVVTEKIGISGLAGAFYRWSDDFTGMQFLRVGVGLSYIFDDKHSLSYVHAIGIEYLGEGITTYANFPLLQLNIRINKAPKEKPARYINY